MDESGLFILDPCPACQGRHVMSAHDTEDYDCSGAPGKQKKLWQDLPQGGSLLQEDDWNNRKFDTKVDLRLTTTVVDMVPSREGLDNERDHSY